MTVSSVNHARSLLFVFATKPERFAKALDSGADCIIIDPRTQWPRAARTDSARAVGAARRSRPRTSARTVVRINAAGTPWHEADLAPLRQWTGRAWP